MGIFTIMVMEYTIISAQMVAEVNYGSVSAIRMKTGKTLGDCHN
jgi:hypothetical protein